MLEQSVGSYMSIQYSPESFTVWAIGITGSNSHLKQLEINSGVDPLLQYPPTMLFIVAPPSYPALKVSINFIASSKIVSHYAYVVRYSPQSST